MDELLNDVNKYFELQEKIFDYFGYQENWKVIPLDNRLDCFWFLSRNDKVYYSTEPFTNESIEVGNTIYNGSVYKQRFLKTHIYKKENSTMICVDTHSDDNKFLMIFDNKKECKDENLIELCEEYW